MRSYKRLSLCLLCCVLLSIVFSPSVNAESVDTSFLQFKLTSYLSYTGNTAYDKIVMGYYTVPMGQVFNYVSPEVNYIAQDYQGYCSTYEIVSENNQTIFESGKTYTLTIQNFASYHRVTFGSQVYDTYGKTPKIRYIEYVASDGGYYSLRDYDFDKIWNTQTQMYDWKFEFTANHDIKRFYFGEVFEASSFIDFQALPDEQTQVKYNHIINTNGAGLVLDVQSEEAGLLSGILGFVSNIKNSVSNMVSKVGEIFTAITDLPSKIWQFIENGLKKLFVPSEDYMASYRDKWDSLLSDRFGAVYQVSSYFVELVDGISVSDATNTIAFPVVSIDLPDDTTFTIGGWDVKIVPDGFDFLATSCKMIVGIISTLAFIGGLEKKYDELMGVEK